MNENDGASNELRGEVLEKVRIAGVDGRRVGLSELKESVGGSEDGLEPVLSDLEGAGLVRLDGSRVELTGEGRTRARESIRRHRLAERLLKDVLEGDEDGVEELDCRFRCAVPEEVEEQVCTLLGHPGECPHGRPIPPGSCCSEPREAVGQAVLPLSEVDAGRRARVVYVTLTEERRLNRLSSFGILPGATVEVDQKFPSFVLKVEETNVAVERDVASNIFVMEGTPRGTAGSAEDDPAEELSLFGKLKRKLIEKD